MSENTVFISYGREDITAARKLCADLKQSGLQPWLDEEQILPGQKWQPAIKRAIENSRYFIALLSSKSVTRRGFVHKELREALEFLDTFPESEIYLIPVRVDECQPAFERLRDLHMVDLFPSWEKGLAKILNSVNKDYGKQYDEIKINSEEKALVERLITFLEDRRILFSQFWGRFGLASVGSIKSIQEIRRRLTDDLEKLPRGADLAGILSRMREACRDFLDKYELLSSGTITSEETHQFVQEFRAVFSVELSKISETYNIPMNKLILSPAFLERIGLDPEASNKYLFSESLDNLSKRLEDEDLS